MALLGHPGKFTYCLAEDEENSPFEPLSTWLGFAGEQSVVTVVGAQAPQSVLFVSNADRPDNAKMLLSILAAGFTRPGTNNSVLRGGAGVVVLNPEHANVLAASGLGRREICQRLYELCEIAPRRSTREGDTPNCFRSPEQILLLVAGGSGLYSMIMPTWCVGPHRNSAVSLPIGTGQMCEIPAAGD